MIEYGMEVDGVVAALRQARRNLDGNVRTAVELGASMVAARAKQVHDYEDRTGVLTNSIMPDPVTGSFDTRIDAIVAAGAPYGVFLEHGTDDHEVRPRFRKALRWPVEGGFGFSAGHEVSGIRPRKFLDNALEHEFPKIVDAVGDAAELSFAQAGLA